MNHQKGMFWFFLLAVAIVTQTALAKEKMLFDEMDRSVSYSAWRVVETKDRHMKIREYHAPEKKRFEMNAQGQDMVMIMRMDKDQSWMLFPQMKTYMKTSTANVNQNTGSGFEVLEKSAMGNEQVNGYATTKYKGIFRDAQGRKGGGYFWLTEEHGIPIKTDMIQQTAMGKQRTSMELTDLKVESQPQSLFEVPDSYRAMPGGMGAIPGGQGVGSMSMNQGDYMKQLQQLQAQRTEEKQERLAKERAEKQALDQLTLGYLQGECWFDFEGPVKFNSDGSYKVGIAAGRSYLMTRGGDSVAEFREGYDGLVSKSSDRFVVLFHGRTRTYERKPCPTTGQHSIAGPGTSQEDGNDKGAGGDTDKSAADKAADTINNATDKIKEGIGSFFD